LSVPAALGSAVGGATFVLLVLPWLNPFAPGPSAAAGPLMFAWLCGALALGLAAWQRPAAVASAWLAAACISAVFGLAQYFGATEWAGGLINHAEPGTAYGNLRQRNQFATLLSIGTLAAVYLATRGASLRLLMAAVVLLAAANAASTSRTGVLQLAVIAALSLWWAGPGGRWRIGRLFAAAAGGYTIAAVALPLAFGALTGQEAATLWGRVASGPACASRMVLWGNVLELIAERPWGGWGIAELDYAHFAHLYDGARFCDILDNAHNLPLHVAVEAGVPLAVALLGALGVWVMRRRPWREADPLRQLAWGVIAVLGLHSLLEYPLWYGPFQITVLLAILVLAKPRAAPGPALQLCLFILVPLGLAYAAWDYRRVSQLYLPPEERAPAYQEGTLAQASGSVLFRRQVKFAELSITPLTRANAASMHELALDMLHFSPEPKVVEAVIDSALQLRDEDSVRWHMLRYRAAFPADYAAWLERAGGTSGAHKTP
jgi:O-antigen ligase